MDIEKRKNYLGGTDAAGVLGLSRWKTPLSVWAEKTGNVELKPLDSEAAELGIELEDYVARRFERLSGKKVRRVNDTLFHPEHPFLGANIDRRIVGEDAILECKTTSAWKAKEWDGEEIPQEYIIQCMHYLAVTGAQRAYIAVLIGNQEFRWKEILRHQNNIDIMVSKEVAFWENFVEPKIIPFQVTSRDKDILNDLFPVGIEGKEIEIGDDMNAIIEQVQALKDDKKQVESKIEELENEIRLKLGDASIGKNDLYQVTNKNQTTKRLDTKTIKKDAPDIFEKYAVETTTRVLRIRKLEEKEKEKGE